MTSIYEDHASLLHYLSQAGLPKPPALTLAAGFAINAGLRRALEGDPIDQAALRSYHGPGQGRPGAARDGDAFLHRRSAHETRHDRTAHVVGIDGDAGPRAYAGARVRGIAVRSKSVAGAEHLVRNPAHLQLCPHLADPGRPAAVGQGVQRIGRVPFDRSRSDHGPGSDRRDHRAIRDSCQLSRLRFVHLQLRQCRSTGPSIGCFNLGAPGLASETWDPASSRACFSAKYHLAGLSASSISIRLGLCFSPSAC